MERDDWLQSPDPRRAAAAWHAAIDSQELTASERIALADWLRRSPVHVQEYLQLSAIQEGLRDPQMFAGISLEELRSRIGSNVDSLPSSGTAHQGGGVRRLAPRRKALVAVAASVLVCGVVGWLAWQQGILPWRGARPVSASYATAAGEQRSMLLVDGSIAELNTRSRISVRFGAAERTITLQEGEALFRVARDVRRPFRVYSGGAVVQAIGTSFTVRRDRGSTTVTVVEGRVSVARVSRQGSRPVVPARLEIGAGERVTVTPEEVLSPAPVEHVEAAAALAWQQRRLVFDDWPLESVIAEFNRYNTRQIRLEGPVPGARSISGVFDANDPDSFIFFLQSREGVQVSRDASGDLSVGAARSVR